MSIVSIAREDIRQLKPYASARAIAGMAPVTLNANESPFLSPADPGLGLNRYPDPQPGELVQRVASLFELAPEQVLVGRGSDEGIDLILRAFCRAGQDAMVQCPPTFGMYAIAARIQGAGIVDVPLISDTFKLDETGVLAACDEQPVKVVFLCSPNNPTGNAIDLDTVARICESLAGRALVVVDEAYGDFCDTPGAVTLLQRFDNLAVLRTLSKAYALAGLRCGLVLSHPEVISLLLRILAPYPVPAQTADVVLRALGEAQRREQQKIVSVLIDSRDNLFKQLKNIEIVEKVWPSKGNFLLFRVAQGHDLWRYLADQQVLVRDVSHYPGLDNCLRVSVGAAHENARFLSLLEDYRP